jgi:hypothetical protein
VHFVVHTVVGSEKHAKNFINDKRLKMVAIDHMVLQEDTAAAAAAADTGK